jgi:hypothetical protein
MNVKNKYNLIVLLIVVILGSYFYFNVLNPDRNWIKYSSSDSSNMDIYYDKNSIKKRFLSNEYQILIKDKGTLLVDVYDDWGNFVGKKKEYVNENNLFYINLTNNTWRFSHSPFERNIEGSGMGELLEKL